jgi:ankyrin repeat protein
MDLPHHERIGDPVFRRAVELLDHGDVDGLRAHLVDHPDLVHRQVVFEEGGYFSNPSLIEFAAENPIRHGRLPANIVDTVKTILDHGAAPYATSALGLVSSGKVPRECGVQIPLIDVLCDHGAEPDSAMLPALAHGEFEAAEALLRRGAKLDLVVAAATGRLQEARQLLAGASSQDRHRAIALAAQHGRAEIVQLLLDAGEDPDRYNPAGCHAHSTPLHQAVCYGRDPVVRLLVERGAKTGIEDTLFHGTPLGWAIYNKQPEIEKYLRGIGQK